MLEAAKTLKETSALPAVCGRVCPQERQCEQMFLYTKLGRNRLSATEQFAADFERETGNISIPEVLRPWYQDCCGFRTCGLAFAGDMIKKWVDVTVFEALHELGGVLRYGIPNFDCPTIL